MRLPGRRERPQGAGGPPPRRVSGSAGYQARRGSRCHPLQDERRCADAGHDDLEAVEAMTERTTPTLLPYSLLVGQEKLKLALELTYVAPRIGGVLISGHRGTGKSTAVRSFAWMMDHKLPVTLPINATDDRVVGGWRIDELMIHSQPVRHPGLLEQATETGVLYIDEVNLLDDHIVNLILDAASTGHLLVQRDGMAEQLTVSFSLVGTMNPEEGLLRPQLLDRFGLMADVRVLADREQRRQILQTVLDFDDALSRAGSEGEADFER